MNAISVTMCCCWISITCQQSKNFILNINVIPTPGVGFCLGFPKPCTVFCLLWDNVHHALWGLFVIYFMLPCLNNIEFNCWPWQWPSTLGLLPAPQSLCQCCDHWWCHSAHLLMFTPPLPALYCLTVAGSVHRTLTWPRSSGPLSNIATLVLTNTTLMYPAIFLNRQLLINWTWINFIELVLR